MVSFQIHDVDLVFTIWLSNTISLNAIFEASPFDPPGIIQSLLLVWLTLETSLAAWFHKEPQL